MMAKSESGRIDWNWATVTLLALLACALGLRVWGIWFGLPHVFHNDEGFEIVRALQLGTGEYNFTRITKGGYFYLLFVEYGFLFIGLLAFGIIGSPAEFGEYYVKDPSAFYLIGRATTAVIGTLTVYMVYRLGRIAYSTSVALFAAALLAFNILHSYLSHLTTVDIPLALLTTVSLYFAVKMALDGNHKNYWWAALFAALATTTKIPAVLLLVPMVIAHCYFVSNRGGTPGQYFFSKHLWQAAAIYLVCYAILTPGIVIYFEQVLSMGLTKFAGGTEVAADLGEDGLDPASPRANLNLFVYYYQAIVDSMTWPIFAVSAAGIAYAIWKHRPVDVILVSFAIVVYVVMSSATHEHHFFPRYMAPALPIFAVLGGRLLGDLAGLFPERRQKVLVPAVIVLLAAWPAAEIAAYNNAMLKPDTRAIAREWFDANIPPGSKVFIEGSRTAVSNATIPLQNSAENLKDSIEFYRDSEPGRAKYFRMALKTLSGSSYDLVGVQGDDLRELQYYKDAGVQYFVLRPDKYGGSALRYHWPEIVEDIRSDPDIELVKRFEPSEATSGRSPLLEIYRVNSNVDLRTRAE